MNTAELVQLCFSRPHAWHLDEQLEVRINDATLAHVETGVRVVLVNGQPTRMGMIAWVCCDPAYRNLGLVSTLIGAAHRWGETAGCAYFGLFADIPRFYERLGYHEVSDLGPFGMVRGERWPRDAIVDLQGSEW